MGTLGLTISDLEAISRKIKKLQESGVGAIPYFTYGAFMVNLEYMSDQREGSYYLIKSIERVS